jgi:hypothetical protein
MMLSTRLHRIPLPRRQQALASAQAWWDAARRDPVLMLWRVTTAPLWLGSDVPIPDAPSRQAAQWGALATIDAGPGRHVRVAMGNLLWRYRVSWFLTSILRGVSLGLWIALIWMLIALATDAASPNRWWVGGLMLLGLVLGAAFGIVNRPRPLRLARSLDQTFHLNERLTTALDPALENTRSPAMQLQYADTANGLAEIRPELGIGSFIPFREVFVALIAGLLLLAAFFADVPGGDLPAASSGVVPPFASAADRLAVQETPPPSNAQSSLPADPPVQDAEVLEQAETSNQTRQDLEALGDAFSDYSLTKPASESIAQGDYDQAADDLNDAAENVDSLSPEARESLADDLDRAASQMSPANPDLAQSAQDTAGSLREEDGDAGEKLNDLADEVDRAGDKVAPNSEIAAGPDTSTSAPQGSAGSSDSQDASGQQQGPQAESPQGAPVEGAGDPGSGASAQPGIANEEIDPQNQQPSQSGSESEPGGQQGGGQAPSQAPPTDGGESPSDASGGEGVPSDSQDGSGSSPGEQGQQDESNASEGGGAGGESDIESPSGEPQQGGSGAEGATEEERPEADTAQQGEAGDPPPGGDGSEDGSSAPPPSSRDSLVLEGTSDENIPSGSDVGSSSLGSGSGASAASGNAAPAAVGDAGPDSNRVPEDYRDYVEDYFNRELP